MRQRDSAKTSARSVTIVCLSDTHELHREVDVPYGDVLIHAGDFTMMSRSQSAISDFNAWLGELPHPLKIVVPGNHDYFIEGAGSKPHQITNATVLVNESIEVMGLRIWGSPTTIHQGGAFAMSLAADRKALYESIPKNVDVLITHGPPLGILDAAPGTSTHVGCQELLEAVTQRSPKLHVFGHVHGAYGMVDTEKTLFVNAALLGRGGDIVNRPIVLQIRTTKNGRQ